jgi:predicted MFS family arabinose efflux permease
MLVALDLVRAAVAICLPFVTEVWQVYLLIFGLQSASAGFTPTFQATIPDVVPDEAEYTRALSLSRIAYDMESLVSPILAAALLTLIDSNLLFYGTAIGFAASAALIVTSCLPRAAPQPGRDTSIYDSITRGIRIYLKTPRLRGFLAVTLAAAAASAMVIVNTVVIVRGLGLDQHHVALALAAFGCGSMCAALALPCISDRVDDRPIMIGASAALAAIVALLAGLTAVVPPGPRYWHMLLGCWLILGVAYAMSVTPGGRLLRRSAAPEDRPALFAAQFALSHVCWLIAYPLVGQLGARGYGGGVRGAGRAGCGWCDQRLAAMACQRSRHLAAPSRRSAAWSSAPARRAPGWQGRASLRDRRPPSALARAMNGTSVVLTTKR